MKTLINRYLDLAKTTRPRSGKLILPTAWKFLPGNQKEKILNQLGQGKELTRVPGAAVSIHIANGFAAVRTSFGHEEFVGDAYELYLKLEFWFQTLPPVPVQRDASSDSVKRDQVKASHAAMRAYNRTPEGLSARLQNLERQFPNLKPGAARNAMRSEIDRIKNQHAAALGRMTSDKKAASSRENGRKGGRPRGLGYVVKDGTFEQTADNLREARKIANGLRDRRSPNTIRIVKILPDGQKTVESFAAAS